MPQARERRSHLVDPHTRGVYHCVSRCVRRAFLCGLDPLSGQSYEHRRGLIEQRVHLLAGCFALGVHAYAVMSNHLHLVIYTDPAAANRWNDDEVIERWRTALPAHKFDSRSPAVTDDPPPGPKVSAERIADKRLRLAWHFWESRFRSQALLDECAITAAMAYVDLNPIRAGIAQTLELGCGARKCRCKCPLIDRRLGLTRASYLRLPYRRWRG